MISYIVIGVAAVLVILLCIGLAIASFSGENFSNELEKAREYENVEGWTTLGLVEDINNKYFEGRLDVQETEEGNDHYSRGVVALSDSTMESDSLASLATIAHEIGHARQDFEGNTLDKHFAFRQVVRILGLFFMPTLIAGIVLGALYFVHVFDSKIYLIVAGVLLGVAFLIFIIALIMKYKEVKIERQASRYAIEFLQEYLVEEEVKLCKDFLDSARLTYWADFFKLLLSWTLLTSKNKMFR